jgi:hypothetical protein
VRSAVKRQARGNAARHSATAGLGEVHGHDGVELVGVDLLWRCTGAMGRERARGKSSEARECVEREKKG